MDRECFKIHTRIHDNQYINNYHCNNIYNIYYYHVISGCGTVQGNSSYSEELFFPTILLRTGTKMEQAVTQEENELTYREIHKLTYF